MKHTSHHSIETLESRIAPATLIGKNTVTYTDVDGDHVTVVLSKPLLTSAAIANNVFTFDTGTVSGSNTTDQQLQKINTSVLGAAGDGVGITVTVKHGATGDGQAAVGYIEADDAGANRHSLGAVSIAGDLGRVDAFGAVALKSLKVHSLGRLGTLSGAPSTASTVTGNVGAVAIGGDMLGKITVFSNGPAIGNVASVAIAGSLLGSTSNTGALTVFGSLPTLKIGHDIVGGAVDTGRVLVFHTLGSVTVGGSVYGGTGLDSGEISGMTGIGAVKIGGDLVAGTADFAGAVDTNGKIASITVAGNITGTFAHRAVILARGDTSPLTQAASVAIGSVTVAGRVEGAQILAGYESAAGMPANADASIGAVTVKGDWLGSDLVAGIDSGADGRFGEKITGDPIDDHVIAGGSATIFAKIASVNIGGLVFGSGSSGDSYAFAAQKYGSFKIHGVPIPIPPTFTALSPITSQDVVLEVL